MNFRLKKLIILSSILFASETYSQTGISDPVRQVLSIQPAQTQIDYNKTIKAFENLNLQDKKQIFSLLKDSTQYFNQVGYLLNSYSYYSLQSDRTNRQEFEQLVSQLLKEHPREEVVNLLFQIIRQIRSEHFVNALKSYLKETQWTQNTSIVLAAIGGSKAERLLLSELNEKKNETDLMSLINALGQIKSKSSHSHLLKFDEKTTDQNFKQIIWQTLANTADKSILSKFDEVIATNSESSLYLAYYLDYGFHLAEQNARKEAVHVAKNVLENYTDKVNTAILVKAVDLYASANYKEFEQYAFLKLVQSKLSPRLVKVLAEKMWLSFEETNFSLLKNGSDELKLVCLANLQRLGKSQDASTLITLQNVFEGDLRISLYKTLLKLNEDLATDYLLDELAQERTVKKEFIKDLVLTSKDKDFITKIYNRLQSPNDYYLENLLSLLAKRKDDKSFKVIKPFLTHPSPQVTLSAMRALPYVVNASDFEELHLLLDSVPPNNLEYVQHALINCIRYSNERPILVSKLLKKAELLSPTASTKYFVVLAKAGDKAGINYLSKFIDDPSIGYNALNAISSSSYPEFWELTFRLLTNEKYERNFNNLFDGFIRQVTESVAPEERKIWALYNVVEKPLTIEQRKKVLTLLGNFNTYSSAILASSFFTDNALSTMAANTFIGIVLGNPSIKGDDIRQFLNQATTYLSGRDGDYVRQSVLMHLNKVSSTENDIFPSSIQKFTNEGSNFVEGRIGKVRESEAEKYAQESWFKAFHNDILNTDSYQQINFRKSGNKSWLRWNGQEHVLEDGSNKFNTDLLIEFLQKYLSVKKSYSEVFKPQISILTEDEKLQGYSVLFDGTDLQAWNSSPVYEITSDGYLRVNPSIVKALNLISKKEYSNFILKFEFRLVPGANNGIGLRIPIEGDAAYVGLESQILDNRADVYSNVKDYQYHGAIYGILPAKDLGMNKMGEWNSEEIHLNGSKVKVILNGITIVEGDILEASKNGTLDKKNHPGLNRNAGHIALLGHGKEIFFRNIRIKEL